MKAFVLDEEAARDWVTELIMANELAHLGIGADRTVCGRDLEMGLDWQPREPGQENTILSLIDCAQQEPGVLTCPEYARITVDFVDDGDDWGYRYLLRIGAPVPVVLASEARGICQLGEASLFGVEAAIGILREASRDAEMILHQLSQYVDTVANRT